MTYKVAMKRIQDTVKVMSFFWLLVIPYKSLCQNTHDHELNALWDQAEFWETAGNTDKMFEYKLKLVDLYRAYYKDALPIMLRNIAVSYDKLPEPYHSKADPYFQEALSLLSKRAKNDSTITSYFDCLFDYVIGDHERKDYVSVYKKVTKHMSFLLDPQTEIQEEKKAFVLNIKYNTVSLINDSCNTLYQKEKYELAESLMNCFTSDLHAFLEKKAYNPNISDLCLSSAWRYADILWALNRTKESVEWMNLHNDFLRYNMKSYDREDHYYQKYLWGMERYLANRYYDIGNNEKDIELSSRIVSEARQFPDSDLLAEKLTDLAYSYDRTLTSEGKVKAQPLVLESIELLSSLPSNENRTAKLLSNIDILAGNYCLSSQYQEAIDLINKHKEFLKVPYDKNHELEVINILGWLSSCYQHLNYSITESREEAQKINDTILDYQRRTHGEASEEYLTQLRMNTFAYQDKDSLIIKGLFSKGYNLWQSVEKKDDINEYASFLGSYLAYLYLHNNSSDYSSIESAMDRICQNDETEFHTRLNYFYNRSVKEENLFNEQAAYAYCDKAISICEQYIERPEIKERLAQMLCQKAVIAYSSENYALAKECSYKASIIIEDFHNDNLLKADILSSLSFLFRVYGDTNKADEYESEASNIRIQCMGEDTPLSVINTSIALLKPEQQIDFLNNAFIDRFKSSPDIVSLLITKAQAYYRIDDFGQCGKTLDLAERLLDQHKDSPLYQKGDKYIYNLTKGQIVYNRAYLNYKNKNIDEAIANMKEYRRLSQSDGEMLLFLNTLYALRNDSNNLKKETETSLNFIRNQISDNFIYMSDSERDIYMTNQVTHAIREIESYAYLCPGNGDANRNAYEAVLLEKGLAINSAYQVQKELKDSNIDQNRLSQLRRQLELADNNEDRERIQLRISLEEQSLQKLPVIREYQKNLFTSIDDIQKALSPNSIVIEFIKYNDLKSYSNKNSYRFGGLILNKDCTNPYFIDLCSEEDLIKEKERGISLYEDDSKLYHLIWEPLKGYLLDKQQVLFSPVDLLCMINLEVIAEGHFDALHFSRISSSRELCNKQRVKPTSNNASLFGGLCYDCPIDYSSSEINNRNYLDFLVNDTITRKGISYLPGSKTEIETIYKISKDKGWKASLYTDNKGTERDYRKLQGKDISVLHLSTHGFALGHSSIKDFDEPMRRCGLLLAGAQPAWNGETHNSDEDGILLGEEIANVPLGNNDIVILSACETGLGELTPDGVWGLQRAFKKAGANSILMSLWKVNDLSTRMFMEEFYRNYFSGTSKSKSLQLARQYIKDYVDDDGNKIFESPYYWAPFILLDSLDK